MRLGAGPRKRHDVLVTIWLVVLLAGLLWVGTAPRRVGAGPNARDGSKQVRSGPNLVWVLGLALVALVLFRFGLHWLAVVGGAALGVARVLPLLRLLPMLQGMRGASRHGGSHDPGASGGGRPMGARPARMSREEALQVLGLDSRATAEDVRREYRRLMKQMHPDLGGSSYLAAKINEARDVLS